MFPLTKVNRSHQVQDCTVCGIKEPVHVYVAGTKYGTWSAIYA